MGRSRADWRTVATLAFRHLRVKPGRAAMLLFGYAVGAGVMMVLLAVGEAMLVQSRDVALVGGGDVVVLPEGIDLEALRTGATTGLFFGIDQARFLERQAWGGRRLADVLADASPTIERKLLYLEREGRRVAIRGGGEIPSLARAVGAGLSVIEGRWVDSPADHRYDRPSPEQLYHELDHFHLPEPDSTWAEWHYFNVAPSAGEWWYITYLVAKRGGRLLVTRHRDGRPPARFEADVPPEQARFDTASANVALGENAAVQRDGLYRLTGHAQGEAGRVEFDLVLRPTANAYFPPVELRGDGKVSGYVVPAVRGTATGRVCEGWACREITEAPAYHDHNWGIWRQTVWNWGQARGSSSSVLYGGVIRADSAPEPGAASPYIAVVVDSLGVRQVLGIADIAFKGRQSISGFTGVDAPTSISFVATRDRDTLGLDVTVTRVQASPMQLGSLTRYFLQMRGSFRLRGNVLGTPVADSGAGFFETFVGGPPIP